MRELQLEQLLKGRPNKRGGTIHMISLNQKAKILTRSNPKLGELNVKLDLKKIELKEVLAALSRLISVQSKAVIGPPYKKVKISSRSSVQSKSKCRAPFPSSPSNQPLNNHQVT